MIACNKQWADVKYDKHACLRPKDHAGACQCMCGKRNPVKEKAA